MYQESKKDARLVTDATVCYMYAWSVQGCATRGSLYA